jgi:hypothetical protein
MSAAGTWKLSTTINGTTYEPILTLEVAGSVLTGSMSLGDHTVDIYDGEIDGTNASWKASIKKPVSATGSFTGIIDGDTMTGTVTAYWFLSWAFTGTRSTDAEIA